MLLNDFFSIVKLSSNLEVISAETTINSKHALFKGHFPSSPVTPGVIQLQIVKEILEEHLKRKLRLKTLRSCKFLKVINPLETPELFIDLRFYEGEFLEVTASGSYGDIVFFKAQASYSFVLN